MKNIEKINEELVVQSYVPSQEEKDVLTFVKKRKDQLVEFREESKLEKIWKQADNEYIPHELDFGETRKRFEQDQDTGLRSRMVNIGGDDDAWRSNNSAPTLLVKIQTAIAVIIDNNPEALLTPSSKKYEKSTKLAYSVWKRNWDISDSKENLKKFVFNLFKYGWAIGRSYPKVIKYNKEVLTEVDITDPSKNKYEKKELVWFNDIAKDNLDPYKTWIDENSKPYDPYSTNDCYFEIDYSYDQAELEFGMYKNWKFVPKNSKVNYDKNKEEEINDRKDIVTIGIYQNRAKDLFVVIVPSTGIVLHYCPLPNDDGMLDIWHTFLMFRSATSPYGVSLWQVLMQDKALFDKWDNMTADQLTLSIMKFGMYTGTSSVLGDGTMRIIPGQAKQMINGKVDWMEIPGPGNDAYLGLEMMEKRMDKNSGISPSLEGEITGKTLGEIQLARESALKRMKSPLENISYAIEQDAYLTLSWAKQIYSTPEIKEFASEKEMMDFEEERGIENGGTNTDLETGAMTAQYYPELALHMEDRDGVLYESKQSRFFQMGKDILSKDLNWRGTFKVIPKSLVGSSEIIDQQTKMQMFNMLVPILQLPPDIGLKPATQLLKVNGEEPEDWLPESWLNPQPAPEQPLMTQAQDQNAPQEGGEPGMNGVTMQGGGVGAAPEAQTVVPRGQAPGMQMKEVIGGVAQGPNAMFNS